MNVPMLAALASSLRQRLIDDMTMRRFSRETQRNYIRDVGRFATFLGAFAPLDPEQHALAMLTIAADRKHLGARIGITAVLHTWGSAMTHHPHIHMIVPVEASRSTGSAGSRPAQLSSCRCRC